MDQTEVRINVIHSAVGAITETDIMLADASDAIVIGFNVRPEPKAKALAEQEKVDMRLYRVIYKVDRGHQRRPRRHARARRSTSRTPARVEVRELFRVPKIGVIAGCYVHGRRDHAATTRSASSATARSSSTARSTRCAASRTT